MRNIYLAASVVFSLASLTISAQAQATQPYDWSGTYVGGTMGFLKGRATTDVSTSDSFPGSYFTPPDPGQIAGEAHGNISQSRLEVGGFGGFGYQFDQLYLGLEANVSSLRFDGSRSSGAIYLSNAAAGFTNELSVRANWQAMLRARLGWVQDRWLTYVAGGVAATRIKMDASFSDDFIVGASGRATSKDTELGWTIGLGAEYALDNNWTIRGEYLYANYGKINTPAFVVNPAFPTLGNNLINSVDLNTQMLSVGVSYRF